MRPNQLVTCFAVSHILVPLIFMSPSKSEEVFPKSPAAKVGSVYTFEVTGTGSVDRRFSVRVKSHDYNYEGKRTIQVESGSGFRLYEYMTKNWVATFRDGRIATSAKPAVERYNWPLKVGKSWSSHYVYTDHRRGRTWTGMVNTYRVIRIEQITVPAGTFKTVRIQMEGAGRSAVRSTHWYSPKLGINVKVVNERTTRHFRGPARFETVLVGMRLPK